MRKQKQHKNVRAQSSSPLLRIAKKPLRPALLILSLTLIAVGLTQLPQSLVKVAAHNQQKQKSTRKADDRQQQKQPAAAAQSQDTGSKEISESALQQMQALEDEKATRTPAQQKISSQLLYAARMQRGEDIAPGIQKMDVGVEADEQGQIAVEISADVDAALLKALKALDVEIFKAFPQYHRINARVSLDQLESIAELPQVHFIRQKARAMTQKANPTKASPAQAPSLPSRKTSFEQRVETMRRAFEAKGLQVVSPNLIPNGYQGVGAANAEGVIAHGIYSARGTFNTDGTGIRIGVLSDGADSVASSQATGDLPPTCSNPVSPPATEHCVNIVDNIEGGDEGTAMMEVIHDMAPGAQLYFATAFTSPQSFAQNIRDLRNVYACDIIVDDVGYSNESPFQDGQAPAIVSTSDGGVITQAVNDVSAAGALYFSSAANSGNKNDNTSGTWEGDFLSGGASAAPFPAGNLHNFGGGQNYDVLSSASPYVDLFWSDPLGASANDYDLFVLNSTGTTILTASTDIQAGAGDPYEEAYRGTNYPTNSRIVVLQKTGAANRFFHLDTNGATMQISTPGSTHGHNAASRGFGVAATAAYSPFNFAPTDLPGPYPNLFTSTSQVEKFSSDGPRHYFFNADSTPMTPGNFSSTGGTVIQQPVLTAADGQEVTGAGGFENPFYGTSCAAPTAAAIAVLIKAANPALTPAQIRTALTSAGDIDIEAAGTDRDSGVGIVMAYPALQAAGVTGKAFLEFGNYTLTDQYGNLNGLVEPGEVAQLNINLKNTGLLSATGITTTLTTSTSGVTIFNNSAAYSNLAAGGGAGNNTTAFTFQLDNTLASIDKLVTFTLTTTYANGWNATEPLTFTVQTGRQPITTMLDTTPPTGDINFPTSTTGTQTTRISRADPPSSCATDKAFPGTAGSGSRRFDSYTLTNFNGAAACATITLTPDKSARDFLQSVAYLGSFNPASIATNYLGDTGVSSLPGYPKTMSVNVPAGATIVIVVNETTALNSGTNTPYTLQVSGLRVAAPSANPGTLQLSAASMNVAENVAGGVAPITVTRQTGAAGAASVNYATAGGTATGGASCASGVDYITTSGTLNWADGDFAPRTFNVTLCNDSTFEPNETFNVNLSGATGASLGSPSSETVTILSEDLAGGSSAFIISEFRLRGPNGGSDEFIELYNNTDSSLTVTTVDGSSGFAVVTSNGVARFVVPNGTVIPARGHYLGVNSVGYSLAGSPAGNGTTATGDTNYATDIPDNTGIALFNTATAANFTLANRLDAVGSVAEANTLYKEGTGYPTLSPLSIDYSFYRDLKGNQGFAKDTDNNAADFLFVDTNRTEAGAGQRLGAPGPENRSSPIYRTTGVPASLIDPLAANSLPPNRVRDFTSDPSHNATFGTLTIRRTFTNNTGANITRLRFRLVDITTFPSPSGTADLRPRTSTAVVVMTTMGNVTAQGTTLEQPPNQINGGGFNSTLSADTVTFPTPLAPGATVSVQLLFGIQQTGSFRILLNTERLP